MTNFGFACDSRQDVLQNKQSCQRQRKPVRRLSQDKSGEPSDWLAGIDCSPLGRAGSHV